MRRIEYFFSVHSAYAYLGSTKFSEIAKAAGCVIEYRPVDLRKVVDACNTVSFYDRSFAHKDYFFRRELERWSQERNVPILSAGPSFHSHEIATASSMVIAAQFQDIDVAAFSHALLANHWNKDADLADRPTLVKIAASVGLDGEELLERGGSDAVTAQYDANTQEAIDRSVFGAPTYFVDGDMFYGQDRLDMVERALQNPYAGDFKISISSK